MTEWWSIGVVGLCVVGVFPAQGRFREPLAVNPQNCNILKGLPSTARSPITSDFSPSAHGPATAKERSICQVFSKNFCWPSVATLPVSLPASAL